MKKVIWSVVILIVIAVVAYNGYLVVRMFSPKASAKPGTTDTTANPSPTPYTSHTPINVAPTRTPTPTLTTVRSLSRMPLPNYFLLSEVAFHLHFSKTGMHFLLRGSSEEDDGITPYVSLIAARADMDPVKFWNMVRDAETFDLLVDSSGGLFYAVSYPSVAADVLAKYELGADNLSNLISLEGGKAYFGPDTGERSSRLKHNEPFPDGKGSYADEVANLADCEYYLKTTREYSDFTKLELFGNLLKPATSLQVSYKGGYSSFTVKWDGGPEWIGQLAIDTRISITSFIPEQSPLAMIVAVPREADRDLVSEAIWSVLMPNDTDAKKKEFTENLGVSPAELAKNIRSRFFMYYPDPESEITPEEAVFGFDLSRNSTLETLLDSFKKGEVFGDSNVMTMLYNGRKISFPAGTAEPGFSIAMINDVLLMSPRNDYIRKSIDVTMQETCGFFPGMDNDAALKLADSSSILLRISESHWQKVFPFLPEGHCGQTNWLAFKFSRRWLAVDTTIQPQGYLLNLFESILTP